jgi:hypothetical protein
MIISAAGENPVIKDFDRITGFTGFRSIRCYPVHPVKDYRFIIEGE